MMNRVGISMDRQIAIVMSKQNFPALAGSHLVKRWRSTSPRSHHKGLVFQTFHQWRPVLFLALFVDKLSIGNASLTQLICNHADLVLLDKPGLTDTGKSTAFINNAQVWQFRQLSVIQNHRRNIVSMLALPFLVILSGFPCSRSSKDDGLLHFVAREGFHIRRVFHLSAPS
ncbi:Uncharacterised protein [Enterobacter cloacae]|nr:Uncharacterised protein [Enterobacter cloacae]